MIALNNYPCTCGHSFEMHSGSCFATYLVMEEWCACLEFKLDNLKYLEQAYDKQVK